jgi:hypothetical protein
MDRRNLRVRNFRVGSCLAKVRSIAARKKTNFKLNHYPTLEEGGIDPHSGHRSGVARMS